MINLDFEKLHSLIPAGLQDADIGGVLMMGFMHCAAVHRTVNTG
jgi:phosphoribosyl-AMP cyclohydrolase